MIFKKNQNFLIYPYIGYQWTLKVGIIMISFQVSKIMLIILKVRVYMKKI